MNEQSCAARKALEEIAALRLNPYCRIVPSGGAVAVELGRASTAALINTIVGRGLAAPCEHAAEVERLRTACDGAEFAIRQCVALKEWGPSTPEHLASRIATLCNLYAGCVDTLGKIADQRDHLRAELDTLKAERQEIAGVLGSLLTLLSVPPEMLEDASELHARLTQEKPEVPR